MRSLPFKIASVRLTNTVLWISMLPSAVGIAHSLYPSLNACIEDRLSLSMFEALRGLRDAVAPESGNAAASHDDNSDPDFEEFYTLFRNGDKDTVDLVLKASGGVAPATKDDFIRIHSKIEMTKDVELVSRLATTVLQKSADVDIRVAALPGMNRSRTEQLQRIEDLMAQNQTIEKEIDEQYALAKERRDQVRKLLRERTGEALGIEDIGD
jgi:hypothetical protein